MKKVKWGVNKFGKALFALTIVAFTGGVVVEAVVKPIDITLAPGELSIDTVPDLSFEGKIGGEYSLTDDSNLNVQVTDFRGNGEGWTLYVRMTELTNEDTDSKLEGATLTFEGTEIEGINVSGDPIRSGGASSALVMAGVDSGMGIWEYEFNDVTLAIPTESLTEVYAVEYTGTLTWTFTNAPS